MRSTGSSIGRGGRSGGAQLFFAYAGHPYYPVPQTVGGITGRPLTTATHIGNAVRDAAPTAWKGMSLIYAYYFMYAFVFSVAIPTSSVYAQRVTGRANLSGPLIATFNFGGLVMQPVQAFLLKRLGLRWSYVAFCTFFVVGSVMYTLAHSLDSTALLFVGRAISGACSGTQLFFEAVHQTIHDPTHRRNAVVIFTLVYSAGYAFALVCAALVDEQITYAASADVNALTVPGILSAVLAAVVGAVGGYYLQPTQSTLSGAGASHKPGHKSDHKSAGSPGTTFVALAAVVVVMLGEGLRQVAIFNVSVMEWKWNTTSASLFAAIAMLIHTPTMVLDHYVQRQVLPLLLLLLVPTTLAFAPWGLALPGAAWLYVTATFLYGPLTRISFALVSADVLEYSMISHYPKVFVPALSAASALGIGLGASVATLWDLSTVPFVVAACLYALCAGLLWLLGTPQQEL